MVYGYNSDSVDTDLGYKENKLWIACQLNLYALLPMFIAHYHTNYAQYVPL